MVGVNCPFKVEDVDLWELFLLTLVHRRWLAFVSFDPILLLSLLGQLPSPEVPLQVFLENKDNVEGEDRNNSSNVNKAEYLLGIVITGEVGEQIKHRHHHVERKVSKSF